MPEHHATLKRAPLRILLVEDDDGDAKAVTRAFSRAGIGNPIHRVCDGIAGLCYLRGDGWARPAGPILLLVDLHMPRMGGIEFVRALRADPSLRPLTAFILTTSDLDTDRNSAFDVNVAGYILKQNAGEEFLRLVSMLDEYWHLVEVPPLRTVS
ncbi:MAG: response regulator [Pseudomonadota bacterium]